MNRRTKLTKIGPDRGALRIQDRDGVLFDLGLGTLQINACIRVSDPDVVAALRNHTGMSVFAPENGVAFFEPFGWRARDVHPILRSAVRFRRAPLWMWPLALLPGPDPRRLGKARWSGVIRFERA